MNIILIYFAIKYKGDWDKIYKSLEDKEKVTLEEIREIERLIKESDWEVITILDVHYPKAFKTAYKPPFVLFYKGDISLLENKLVCATGNYVDDITKKRINEFIPELEKARTLVVPSFKGVDQEIEKVSTKNKVYLLASGLKKGPMNNEFKKGDLMITEYPYDSNVSKDRLRNRNRLIASMSEMLILFTSEADGGMNNMVSNFLNNGKDIYCFPGDGSEKDGNSELIKQGATLITKIKDISN